MRAVLCVYMTSSTPLCSFEPTPSIAATSSLRNLAALVLIHNLKLFEVRPTFVYTSLRY
jgi:hypothetical protein